MAASLVTSENHFSTNKKYRDTTDISVCANYIFTLTKHELLFGIANQAFLHQEINLRFLTPPSNQMKCNQMFDEKVLVFLSVLTYGVHKATVDIGIEQIGHGKNGAVA